MDIGDEAEGRGDVCVELMEGCGDGRGRWSVGEVGVFGFAFGLRIFERGMFSRSSSESSSISPGSFVPSERAPRSQSSVLLTSVTGPGFSSRTPSLSVPPTS